MQGFVTGYYEPVIDGSRTQTDVYTVPRLSPSLEPVRPRLPTKDAPGLPNKGQVFRKIGRRKLVPYYDRAEIEDGAIAGRGLEICWLKEQDRSAVRANPGLGADPPRGRLDHAHQLRRA